MILGMIQIFVDLGYVVVLRRLMYSHNINTAGSETESSAIFCWDGGTTNALVG